MICETARLRNHLWFDGITYQGACAVEHFSSIVLVGLDVVVPELALLVVALADLPVPRRIVEPLLEALELLLGAR